MVPDGAVGAEHKTPDAARFVGSLDDNRPSRIAEKHTGRPIAPIHEAAEDLDAHDQNIPVGASGDELFGDHQRVDPASAASAYDKRGDILGA